MTSGQTSLEQMLGVYKWVVDDVIKNVREDFLNEGADTQVLEDLKQLWENKLVQSGALSRPVKSVDQTSSAPTTSSHKETLQKNITSNQTAGPVASTSPASVIQQAPPRVSLATPNPLPPPLINAIESRSNLPTSTAPPEVSSMAAATTSSAQTTPPLLGMNIAALAQQQAALYSAMAATGTNLQPVLIPGATGLPGGIPLIQHGGIPYAAVPTATGVSYIPITSLNLTGQQQQQQQQQKTSTPSNNIPQSDGPLPLPGVQTSSRTSCAKKRKSFCGTILQLDGPPPVPPPDGSSSDDSDESSESDADDLEDEPNDEEPLNSNDDAESDEEEDVWETENTIVCQFEKVYRVRSKWKFSLKDGIMHLKGHDYIFTKTNGEAEW